MTHSLSNPDTTKYVVCHNGNDIYHYTTIESGELKTGQPNMDVFDSEQKAYDAHGEDLPPRYQVIESRTDGTLELTPIDSDIPIDGAVIDEVALEQTAFDRYDALTK
ncbi:hypothetical protein OSG_eHP38_00010 [environmental Halophage eHP-38]|nr:hypothetical protein OSG_eHP38_00010 [environmental Halophage eHP-38]